MTSFSLCGIFWSQSFIFIVVSSLPTFFLRNSFRIFINSIILQEKQPYVYPPRTLVLNTLFVALLLLQTLLPAAALSVVAAPLPSPLQQEEPPLLPVTVDEPTTDPLPETAPTDVATSANITPSLPAAVQIALDRTLLVAQETAILTITVYGQPAASIDGMNLTLTLPTGLATSDGTTGALVWPVPSLAENEPFVQIIPLQIDQPTLAGSTAVALLTTQLAAPGYLTGYWYSTLGLALSEGGSDPVQTVQQGANGAVLQGGDGLVTLLVKADAAEGETTFTYTELYRWDQQPVTMTTATAMSDAPLTVTLDSPLTTTVSITPTLPLTPEASSQHQTLLPIIANVSQLDPATTATSDDQVVTADNEKKPKSKKDEGVDLYYSWQFDAAKDNQEVKEFKKPVKVTLSLTKLAAAGLDPASVQLWTRKKEKMRWTLVKTDYDAEQQALVAWLPHFSQFGLGAGLSQRGDILPSVVGFMTDRLTGGVSIQYPIETPAGVGGLNPNLSFAYSSMSADDLFLDSGNGYLSQSSGVGLGWSVAGSANFIVRTDNKLDNNTADNLKTFSLVLNGMRVGIRFEESEWRTDPETFYRVMWDSTSSGNVTDWGGWTLVAPDGTKYEFGDNNAFGGNANTVSTSPTVTYLETSTGGTVYRLANQWYLRRVSDPLGNEIVYQYKTEKSTITTNDCMGSIPGLDRWYTAAVYPTAILWNQNSTQGLNAGLRVLFTYNTTTRDDYRIKYHETTDCNQVKFALSDWLSSVKVEALVSGSWVTQRTYALGNSHAFTWGGTDYLYTATNGGSSVKRLLLHYLDMLGKNNTLLQRYSFTYQLGDTDPNSPYKYNPNQVYLVTANNGWGGKITYTLTKHRAGCHTSICGGIGTRDIRFAVTRTRLEDGLNNSIYTDYSYGNPNPASGSEIAHIGKEDGSAQFFGFERSEATYYATVSGTTAPGTVLKWDAQDAWPPMRSDSDNPDPRVGKLKKVETRLSSGGAVVAVTNYNWQSYRRVNNAWVFSDASKLVVNNNTTYPVIWVRKESEDSWAAGGNWNSGSYAIDSSGGSGKQTKTTYDNTASYRGYGNVTQVEELSHSATSVTQATWNSAVSGGTLLSLRKTKTDYSPNTTAYIVNKPARVRVTDGADVCKAETRYIYGAIYSGALYITNVDTNDYTSTPLNSGLLVKSQQALGSCTTTASIADTNNGWAITRITYNAYGNQTSVNQLGNNASQSLVINTSYDLTYRLFPISQDLNGSSTYVKTARYYGVNEIAGHGGVAIWGAMQEHCGVNEVCTRQVYDEFGRKVRRWEGVGKSTSWGLTNSNALVEWGYSMFGGSQSASTITEWRNPRAEGNFVRKVYNGLGQLIQEQGPYQDWATGTGQEVIRDYLYDAVGNQTRSGMPRLIAKYTSGDLRRSASWSGGYNQTEYNTFNAVSRTFAPNGEEQRYNYAGRAMSIVGIGRNGDSNKMLQWQQVDGLGYPQLIQTHNPSGSSWAKEGEIGFTYDVTGNLLTAAHPSGIGTTSLTYDISGRKISMADPDLGSWSYAYDRQGKLTRQTDARSQTICLYYDGMARLVGKHFRNDTSCPASPTYDVNYAYDQDHTASNRSRGQLTNVGNSHYGKHLYYNSQGLLAREEIWISGIAQNANTYYGYDSYLRPTTATYPDNEVVTTGYNGMGLPNSLSSSTGATVVDSTSYDAAGRITQMRLPGSGILYQTYTYWPWVNGTSSNSNGRLKEIKVGTTNTNAASDSNRLYYLYGYDSFGNVGGMTEQYNSGTSATYSFCYDTQNRLSRAYAPYDSTKNCATYATGQVYSYDSAGRMTGYEGAGQSFTTPKDSGHGHGAKWSKIPGSGSTSTTITIRAHGMNGGGWPNMELWVNGVRQQTWAVGSSTPSDYAVNVVLTGNDQIDVTFTNDAVVNGADRNLFVDYVRVGSTTIQAESSMIIDRGEGNAMFDGNDALVGGEWLFWSSALRFVMATDPAAALVGYDLNGNVSYKLNNNQATHFTFNAENRLTEIRRNGVILESYLYDVDGQRVRKSSGGNTTYYPNQYYEQYSGNNVDKYYYFNGQPILLSRNGWPVYLHNDYLNTMAIVTNNTTRVDDQGFYAYGRVRRGGIGIERSYTGQQRDFNSGLIYMNARYYDPELGQFLSPDTLVPDPGNLFDYNRYMYVRGNPMMYNDPTGHDPCGPGANAFCDEYQQASNDTDGFAVSVSYTQFAEGAVQYGAYTTDPTRYYADKLVEQGVLDGNVAEAQQRITLAQIYASYYLHQPLEKLVPASDVSALIEQAQSSDDPNSVLVTLGLVGAYLQGKDSNQDADDFARMSGMLRDAARRKGNFGIGSATADEASVLGEAWVGPNHRISSTDGRTLYN